MHRETHEAQQHWRRKVEHMGRHMGRSGGRSRRGRGRQTEAPPTSEEELRAWFAGNLPDDWFTRPVDVAFDRDEIIVTGDIGQPEIAEGDDRATADQARIQAFREQTREPRMEIASRAEGIFRRKVSWAVSCGDETASYTVASVPVMTRLHLDERRILDTLIDAGVARSRSEALAWCVRLVADNEADWLTKLREAMTEIEALRNEGPSSRT